MVEHQLPKLRVAGSIPVVRSSGIKSNPLKQAGVDSLRARPPFPLKGGEACRNGFLVLVATAVVGCVVASTGLAGSTEVDNFTDGPFPAGVCGGDAGTGTFIDVFEYTGDPANPVGDHISTDLVGLHGPHPIIWGIPTSAMSSSRTCSIRKATCGFGADEA